MKNMSYFFVCLFLMSCSSNKITNLNGDIFDQLFFVHKTNSIENLKAMFGEPDTIVTDPRISEVIWRYKNWKEPFEVAIDPKKHVIVGSGIYFWKDFDNYEYMKKRFGKYKWIEKEVLPHKNADYVADVRQVSIPDLGMSFEYDDQDPKRHIIIILINAEKIKQ